MAAVEQCVVLERLVKSGEEQMFVVVLECCGYLCPVVLQLCGLVHDGLLIYRDVLVAAFAEAFFFYPSSVPVVV